MKLYVILQLLLLNQVLSNPLANEKIAKPRQDDITYRLPKTVSPYQYDIHIEPNFEQDAFTGTASIMVTALQKTSSITIHQKELTFEQKDIQIKGPQDETILVNNITLIAEQEFVVIFLKTDLKAKENYTITFTSFKGKLNEENEGFYLAYFVDKDGKKRKFGTTQFEPTHARRAFPCFDEPEYKAVFYLNIKNPNGYMSITNTLKLKSNGTIDEFKPTPIMSTYLVAFIVSEMELSENLGIHRILTKPQDILNKKQKCALEIGNATIVHLENYLEIPYGLEKLDQAAIPDEYFKSGAMENWGLATYRESRLLCSSKTTAARKQIITAIIAHEFAHQWFGNLVSPTWWNFIWLNEGFATYFEAVISDLVYPDMEFMQQFLVSTVQLSLFNDGFADTRELNMAAESPAEVWALFDTIAYDKGASIIHMMNRFLTTPVLRKGLNNYLNQMAYKTATPSDLYSKIQEVIDESVIPVLPSSVKLSDIMSTWDSQKGFPVVNVTRNYGKDVNNVHLTQTRFLMEDLNASEEKWIIPINFVSANYPSFSDTTPDLWLSVQEKDETVPYVSDSDWIIMNKKQTGYYRVNYDENNWNLIKEALISNHNKIDVLNRAQIVDDSFTLSRSGRLNYDIPMSISVYLKKENEYVAFHPFYKALKYLDAMLYFTSDRNKLKTHVLDVLEDIYNSLHFNETSSDKHTVILNRENVIHWVCKMGHSECRSTSLEKFRLWKDDHEALSVNLRPSVFCAAMRTGDASDYDFLYKKATELELDERELRSAMISALGCSENKEILLKYLNSSIEDNAVFGPDLIIPSVCNGGEVGLQTVLDFLSTADNFKKLQTKSGDTKQLLNVVGSLISGEEQLKQFQELSDKNDASLFKNALEKANANKKWLSTTGSFVVLSLKESSGSMLLANVLLITTFTIISVF